jgi:hypothetical protein
VSEGEGSWSFIYPSLFQHAFILFGASLATAVSAIVLQGVSVLHAFVKALATILHVVKHNGQHHDYQTHERVDHHELVRNFHERVDQHADLGNVLENLEKAEHFEHAAFQEVGEHVFAQVPHSIVLARGLVRQREDDGDDRGHRGQDVNPAPDVAEVLHGARVGKQVGHDDFKREDQRHEQFDVEVRLGDVGLQPQSTGAHGTYTLVGWKRAGIRDARHGRFGRAEISTLSEAVVCAAVFEFQKRFGNLDTIDLLRPFECEEVRHIIELGIW